MRIAVAVRGHPFRRHVAMRKRSVPYKLSGYVQTVLGNMAVVGGAPKLLCTLSVDGQNTAGSTHCGPHAAARGPGGRCGRDHWRSVRRRRGVRTVLAVGAAGGGHAAARGGRKLEIRG